MPIIETIGEISNGEGLVKISDKKGREKLSNILNKHPHLFIKIKDGECGVGATTIDFDGTNFKINGESAPQEEVDEYFIKKPGNYIVQDRLVQNEMLNKMYPHAINTLRIVTIRNQKTGKVEILGSILRIGVKNMEVDNWASGGIAVGVKPNGHLEKYGFYKPGHGFKCTEHPDSHINFQEFVVPDYQKAEEKCIQFHSSIPQIHSIGWDVALTDNGPVFIEGNDNWELGFIQMAHGGIKQRFLASL